jgi:hypothetical protein
MSHSSIVKIRLLINGCSIDVAQMGPDCLFINSPIDAPPGEATIVLTVDETERHWKVLLPDGICASSEKITIAALPPRGLPCHGSARQP